MIKVLAYGTTNVTKDSYVSLDASVAKATYTITVIDTSNQLLSLAIGAVGKEADIAVIFGNGAPNKITANVPVGARLSIKGISGSATTGFCTVSYA